MKKKLWFFFLVGGEFFFRDNQVRTHPLGSSVSKKKEISSKRVRRKTRLTREQIQKLNHRPPVSRQETVTGAAALPTTGAEAALEAEELAAAEEAAPEGSTG